MPSFINTNISSLNAQRNLNTSQSALATSLQRLSSGLRINSAKDDAAGMAISSRMTSQINGNNQAARNANDGISLAQTAEGDLAQIGTNLQRMRDLAVQSANATNSASDRAALQAEVASLAAEIDRVAQNSSFNGVKLLDGSFTAQNFQVGAGATANDSISISSIASARTNAIGSAGTTSTATVTGSATTTALAAGNLTLNGQQVGASTAGTGGGLTAASATQIAIAINAVSALSTVTATANATTVVGGAPASGAIAANAFSINGVSIGAVLAGGTAAGQGANVAAAINGQSTQTGVTASANATTGAVTLTAADGRDINILTTTAGKAALVTATGFAAANVLAPNQTVVSGAFTAPTSVGGAGTWGMTIDGIALQAPIAVNAGGTIVTAATLDASLTTFLAANTGYSATGTFAAGTLQLSKADGTAIAMVVTLVGDTAAGTFAGGAGFLTTAANGNSNHGTITLSSTGADGVVVGGASSAFAGLSTGVTAASAVSSVSAISAVNVSTSAGATAALSAIDGAIATVNSSRASLGAYQNRFASVVTTLQTTSENLTASRSRIMDTDFAAETSQLTRNQILQQAGTAMLAQANQLPQNVLTLLR